MSEVKNTLISFFKGGIHNVANPEFITLEAALDYIKTGKEFEPLIRELRSEKEKEKRQELKKKLSYFIFSGTFKKRNAKELVDHSGLLVIDFDNVADVLNTRLQLQADPFTLALFKSPGGDGLKLLVRIYPDKHLESFKALEIYFKDNYQMEVDKSGKDVCRACYTSADTSLFFNPDAQLFTTTYVAVDEETGEVKEVERVSAKNERRQMTDLQYSELMANRVIDAAIDLTDPYDNWMLLAFSMASLGEPGRELFQRLSSMHVDYDHKKVDEKFDNAIKTTRFTTPKWFWKECKQRGLDTSYPKDENGLVVTPRSKAKEKAKRAELEHDDDANLIFTWPKGCEFANGEERMAAENSVKFYQHFSHKNITYMATFKAGDVDGLNATTVFFKRVSNFAVHSYYVVMDEEGKASRIVQLINARKESILAIIPTEAFTSVQEFSKYVERGNYYHSMSKPEFTKLKAKIYDDCKHCKVISTLGLQPEGFFAFANGIWADSNFVKIDDWGVVQYKEAFYFLPALSAMYKDQIKMYQSERQFLYVKRSVSFGDWADLFCQVYGENGKIGLMFYLASMFSDVIFKVENFFPILYLYGKPSSGKTTMAISLISMLQPTGETSIGSNINSTPMPALFRQLGQVRNGIVLIEEYNNDLEKRTIEYIKQTWNRIAYTKSDTAASNTSTKTVGLQVESATVMTGQHLPNVDVALFTRCILLSYFKKESYTDDERDLMVRLKDMQSGSLTQISCEIMNHRKLVKENFQIQYTKEKKEFSKHFKGADLDRVAGHCAQLMAIYTCLKEKLHLPFNYEQLKTCVLEISQKQIDMMLSSQESSTFWEILQHLFFQNRIFDESDFCVRKLPAITLKVHGEKKEKQVEFGEEIEVLFLRLNKVHGLYLSEMGMQRRKGAMDKTSLANYLENSKQFIGQKASFRFKDSVTSCYVFNYSLLKATGITLEKLDGQAMSSDDIIREDKYAEEGVEVPTAILADKDLPF